MRRILTFLAAMMTLGASSGGRGGKVVEVTNLNDAGEGSLRWALTEAGRENATIVFRVSGIINIGPNPQRKGENSIRAKLKNVTIAGQTAPGEGILLRGGKLNLGGSENVIIRNIRSRLGTKGDPTKSKKENFIEGGAIGIENARNIIIVPLSTTTTIPPSNGVLCTKDSLMQATTRASGAMAVSGAVLLQHSTTTCWSATTAARLVSTELPIPRSTRTYFWNIRITSTSTGDVATRAMVARTRQARVARTGATSWATTISLALPILKTMC